MIRGIFLFLVFNFFLDFGNLFTLFFDLVIVAHVVLFELVNFLFQLLLSIFIRIHCISLHQIIFNGSNLSVWVWAQNIWKAGIGILTIFWPDVVGGFGSTKWGWIIQRFRCHTVIHFKSKGGFLNCWLNYYFHNLKIHDLFLSCFLKAYEIFVFKFFLLFYWFFFIYFF